MFYSMLNLADHLCGSSAGKDLNSTKNKGRTVELVLNGQTIHSLKELRENFDAEELMDYHRNGDLLLWLNQHYYETEANAIEEIDSDQPGYIHKLCAIFDVEYLSSKHMTSEEQALWEEKKQIVSKYTSDPSILSELWLVAMNQEELAALLDQGEKKIYLCNESFSIPIKVAGVDYICIGNVTIDNPYTKEQYEKAGITVTGITLPLEENQATAELAKKAAEANGYDYFGDTHSPLTTEYHDQLKYAGLFHIHHVSYNNSLETKYFKSKSECKNARDTCIKNAYSEAESYTTPDNSNSFAKKAALFYSDKILAVFQTARPKLEALSTLTGTKETYAKLLVKVNHCYDHLLAEFEKELIDNKDYYDMYDLDYFINQVDIEEHDYRIGDDFLTRTLEGLFTDSVEYTINDLHLALNEIESDLNNHANTFYRAAFNIYKCYITDIEELLEQIGKNLPDKMEEEDFDAYMDRCCLDTVNKA